MKNIKRISLIAFTLIVIGVVGSVVSFIGMDTSTTSVEQEIDGGAISHIDVSANNAHVTILRANDSDIKVAFAGRKMKDVEDRLDVNVNEDTLVIQTINRRKWFNINFFSGSLELTIYLPDQVYDSLIVGTNNGRLQLSQLNIDELQAETDNGHIELVDLITHNVDITSNNGNVYLGHVDGIISGKTNNGSLTMVTSQLDRSIEWHANNGSIKVETETEPTNVIFDLKSNNGRISVFGSRNWDIVVGEGEHTIKLSTDNGHISVVK